MAHIAGEITIDRPVADVFDVVADERNEPRYNPRLQSVEKTSDGPIGAGSSFRAVATTMGRAAEMTIQYTGFERPQRLSSITHMSMMEIEGTLTFAPVERGTRLSWSWDVRPLGLTRLFSPFITRIGERQEMECWTGLKRYLESSPASPTGASEAMP